jgi:hypothetical protein
VSYYGNDFENLEGKKILSIEVNEQLLRFNLPHSAVCYEAYGDCCSSSYIESIDNPEIFNDAIFLGAESVSGETKEVSGCEYHKWTFYKFKTSKGMATLSFRNESNGYYNGYLELIES